MSIESRLEAFAEEFRMTGKGPLSVALVLTRSASKVSPPYNESMFLTKGGGQVKGCGRGAAQAVLADHGISRVLAEEGGRTSRGSIERMRGYIALLNEMHSRRELDFRAIELWWIERVKEFFASAPLKVRVDASKSLRHIIAELIKAAFARQEECPGVMVAGAVLQHLVGAKLTVALPDVRLRHEGFAVADSPGRRKGDFLVHDTVVHVTTVPTEGLVQKCCKNLEENLRPIIVTIEDATGSAKVLARNAGVEERIDVLEIEQFIATNVYEWSLFQHRNRPTSIAELIKAYNAIVDQCETDPSLRIDIG